MKPTHLPILTLDAFPAPRQFEGAFYLERLETHVRAFPHVNVPHGHDFYLLLYVTQGTGTHTIDLLPHDVAPGALFLMAPGQAHTWALSADAAGYVLFFDAGFYLARFPAERLEAYPFFTPGHAQVLQFPPDDAEVLPLLLRLRDEYTADQPGAAEVARALLFVALEVAARHAAPAPLAETAANRRHLRAFGRLLNEHFRTHRAVGDYAERLHLTPNHLNAVCQQVLGKTARAVIAERVIAEAQRLLALSTQSVAQVADELGFEDASYFSRYFRKHTGQTPEAFRKSR